MLRSQSFTCFSMVGAGPYLEFFVCGRKLYTPSQVKKKHLLFPTGPIASPASPPHPQPLPAVYGPGRVEMSVFDNSIKTVKYLFCCEVFVLQIKNLKKYRGILPAMVSCVSLKILPLCSSPLLLLHRCLSSSYLKCCPCFCHGVVVLSCCCVACRLSSVLSKTSRGCPDVKQRKLLLITLFIFSIVSKEVGDDIDAGLGKQDGGWLVPTCRLNVLSIGDGKLWCGLPQFECKCYRVSEIMIVEHW